MPFAIGSACVDVTDRSCIEECPVDCIYEGDRKFYINPKECIDCGACEPVCPVEAIIPIKNATGAEALFIEDNAKFFLETLPGRPGPLGNPGGSMKVGVVGADTTLVRDWEPEPA
jgi:NAD-dependent dihydropyrimidine dehydrogenase PreA subunit